jgi:hypothetical protein
VTDTDTPSSSESPTPPVPGEQRRLAHPPSDRYLPAEPVGGDGDAAGGDASASVARGVAIAITVTLVGAAAMVVLGGVATVTTGLIVVAGAIGFGVAVALQLGAGGHLSPGRRIGLAVILTVASVVLGQIGIWRYALAEGGVLPLVDYLDEVFGPLVIVELVVGTVVAWVVAR